MSYDLDRFVDAQNAGEAYLTAYAELRAGQKRSHWMWFVFPQIAGLARSETSKKFVIHSVGEAKAYWRHEVLGQRLSEATSAILSHVGCLLTSILGTVDALKFRSSMTLFELATREDQFGRALDQFCLGERDPRTLEIVGAGSLTAGRNA